ncbi:MAG: hypothetical protein JNM56_09255 [Planctomycetia bacterium]|nr:hypothetical protein [Planctomycetia bacterium]
MKRRRQTLQVSTFPFLAVLLCTMGSLILVLMVMDRRARIVARARLQAAVVQKTAEQEAEERKRKEEWEQARRALQALLERELSELRGQKAEAAERAVSAEREIQAAEAARRQLRDRLETQRSELDRKDRELRQQGLASHERAKLTDSARGELERLRADLDAMEKTLADLKSLRHRKEQAYSLVPYRGKHGDDRRPIYAECTARGVAFHPGRVALEGYEVSPTAIRLEIDRRLARIRAEAGPQEAKEQPAYVLVLLRPSGIRNYYQFVSALAGLKIDFGYELLDEGWELAFGDNDQPAGPSSWGTTGGMGPGTGGNGTRPGSSWAGSGATDGWGGTPGATGAGSDPGGRSNVPGGSTVSGPVAGRPGFPGTGSGPGSGFPQARLGSPLAGTANSTGNGVPGGIGGNGGVTAGNSGNGATGTPGGGWSPLLGQGPPAGGVPGASVGSAGGTGTGGTGNGGVGTAGTSGPVAIANSHPSGGNGGGTQPGSGMPGSGMPGSGTPGQAQIGSSGGSPGTGATGNGQSATNNGVGGTNPGTPGGTAGAGSPQGGPPSSGNQPATPGGARTAAGNRGGQGAPGNPNDPRAAEEPEPINEAESPQRRTFRDPLAPPPTAGGQRGPRNPLAQGGALGEPEKPARPLRVASNRDWVIVVECTADAVKLPGAGQRFALADLQRAGSNNPLLQAVRATIARRQATVRPTEPEWKPQLRFLVHADGLRSYYVAFPALEPLGLPMTKQNREAPED